ncbi:MAG: alpha-2-macroglobulin family protein [Desulfobacter sp.]|nr:MAG: alpha-2-macroglobulin family protein [Desulfobacter sp.]
MKPLRIFLLFIFVFILPAWASAAEFEALFAGQQTVDGENALAVTFSKAVDGRQDMSPYLKIMTDGEEPVEGAWILAQDPQVVYFTQVEADTAYKIRVKKGLKSESGDTLEQETLYEVRTRSAEPMIAFGSRGFILASKLIRGLPVDSLNIDKADIDFFRVRPEMTAEFRKNFRSSDYMNYYQSRNLAEVADLVYSGRWDLEIKKDLRTQVNIPITHIKELKAPGIYFAVLRGAGRYEYGYNTTWFTISDLGVHARIYKQNLNFYVQSLETAKPVNKARVEGFDKKGRSLFAQPTDKSGRAIIPGRFEKLALVSVTRGNHITLMPMDVPALDLSEFAMGQDLHRPVQFFAYGPRDIYRPGETVVMDGILRNHDGGATPGLPIRAKVKRPDGRMVREFTLKPGAGNHFSTSFTLPENALTGKWQVAFSGGAGDLDPYEFVVSEFLPERMKLEIAKDEAAAASPDTPMAIQVQGDFLYGAPAAGSRVNALVHIKPARELFKDQWPGFEFGGIKHLINTSFTTDDVRLDDAGKGVIPVENRWKGVTSPHWVTANVSLYDSGGRPVVRNTSRQIWPADGLVGIRNLSPLKEDAGRVPYDSTAEFEVILADAGGKLQGAKGLKATVIREHREYYWEYKNNEWHWGFTSQFYPVDRFKVDIDAAGETAGRARVAFPVKWGGYRLEILNPATGLTTAYRVRAGWDPDPSGRGGMNRPDRVDLALDKPAYGAGDKALVTVKAPQGGRGWLFVDAQENLLTLPIDLPAAGKAFEIDIDPAWNRHDIYVSALVVRPGESRDARLPRRSVGLVHLPLDRSSRQLAVKIQAPDKTQPNKKVDVTVSLKTAAGKAPSKAMVTLAAVDVGILNLTGFKTPSPFDYFFRPRKYGPALQDVYQKLIEANKGAHARQRFGGDAPTLTRGGDRPSTDVQIVALYHRAVEADDQGNAGFTLDLPDFDGRLRLMAVAHTAGEFGAGEREMILASPLVVQATMPRFLAAGDRAKIMLDLHNLTEMSQSLTLEADIFGPISFEGESVRHLELAPSAKAVAELPVAAGAVSGRARITCRINGIKAQGASGELVKNWYLETRSPYPPLTKRWKRQLAPGETLSPGSSDLEALVSGTIAVQAGLDTEPPVNLADHVGRLMAYPYGCLEQTVSGLFPHVLLTGEQFAGLGVATTSQEEKTRKINTGIQRLMEKQKSSGGFGLWNSSSPEEAWLTAYAVHFMVNAADAGFEMPEAAGKKAFKRLVTYVRRPNMIPVSRYVEKNAFRAAVRSYAAFVLARTQSLSLGDARSVFAYARKHAKGPLALVQAGAALGLAGDRHRAGQAFAEAVETGRDRKFYVGDYGSRVRDMAVAYYCLTTWFPDYKYRHLFLEELDKALAGREWLSTQERNALVMAGAARLASAGKPWQAQVTVSGKAGTYSGDRPGQVIFTRGAAASGFEVKNTGTASLYADLVLTGYPNAMPAPSSEGVEIRRRFLDAKGQPMDPAKVKSGDRIIVELSVTPSERMPHALVVDMVPAGVELEDPNVAGAFLIDDVLVDKKRIREWQTRYTTAHTEYRDDRFVAALNLVGGRTSRVFYGARVVSPGSFKVPPPLVEDMYRPYIRGIGNTIEKMEVAAP